ncbi:RagB/SusD family nutrient uptake outer membrane protein [Chitinophaga silvatica]|uniref:RagB/SusD family nutrient uptake outer membrane protein n=1 Tax=Chitinophaga silvatica TaxID=2282649 RepID=A0A3E1Y277_9BACT|nr:RagB/SusD family nutrient uptake outer membrane protein [Chitinophaga silvatica]RFS18785.1 RagB/SusD family nutrient uptake outer membrane protein [Chitinophaga silvatica]
MKNIKKIYVLLACTGYLATGCNKSLLNTEPHDRYTEETFWRTPEAAAAGLVSCYSVLRNDGMYGGKGSNNATALWDETLSPNAYNQTDSYSFNTVASGAVSSSTGGIVVNRYKDAYTGVGRCNTLLDRVDGVPGMDPAAVRKMKGEARFLRGLYYFTLASYYGGVPLILEAPDNDKHGKLPRTARELVVKQVIEDLDSAANMLPVKYTGGDIGRATKGAAMALKARVLLYEASDLFNTTKENAKWAAAAAAAKAVMDLSGTGYDLFTDYRSLFYQANENNKEVIFDVQYLFPKQGSSFDLICTQYNTNAPLLDLANTYYMKSTGLPISNPASGYDPAKPYEGRDPRLTGTFTFPGDIYKGAKIDNKRFAITGYGMKKYSLYDSIAPPKDKADLKDGQSEINFIVLRFADILLMYAEAQNEAAGPDGTVYTALNRLRDRIGMPHFPAGLSKEEMRQEIRHERRVELAGEGLYYNDIRRWKAAEIVMNANILKYDGTFIEKRVFNADRNYLWPIPQTEKDLNPNLEQNPNY